MKRFHQLLFSISLVALSWFGMMASHELGHVVGAVMTGGTVRQVVLHPLTISRTDVDPNPAPGLVVWMGPILGTVLPLMLLGIRRRSAVWQNLVRFFAGFCLIANGAYIGTGWIDRIGDCSEMILAGTPIWLMVAFGVVALSSGLWIWHQLGSLKQFIANPARVTARRAYAALGLATAVFAATMLFSPR
jgi:hypothetical protein